MVVFMRQVGVVSDYDLLALDSISGTMETMTPNLKFMDVCGIIRYISLTSNKYIFFNYNIRRRLIRN